MHPNAVVEEIITDTRKIHNAAKGIFFALSSARDGHKYIKDAYTAGIRNFVVGSETEQLPDANYFTVNNTLAALQTLAAHHRKQFTIPVVGITGSNGKTIVKEWLHHILKQDVHIVRSPKSYNSQIGVPLSVWEMNETHTLALFEAGISKPGEMQKLQPIIEPTVGIFTNIGDAHNEGFESKKQKATEKANLFTNCQKVVYCEDDTWVKGAIDELKNNNHNIEGIGWSFKGNGQITVKTTVNSAKTLLELVIKGNTHQLIIPFTDSASIENAVHCAVTLLALGYDMEKYAPRFADLAPVEMRLQLKKGWNNCDIINDAYTTDLHSLAIALDFLNAQKQHKNRGLILSDIVQSGLPAHELYSRVAALLHEKQTGFLIGIGKEISAHAELFSPTTEFFETTEDFLTRFNFATLTNATILIKGARDFRFEKITQRLEEKTHETILEINLGAMVQNLSFFRGLVGKTTGIMAMVKAYSYGSGTYETANVLQFHGADYLAVAYADEGIELRKKGISLPIMVMNPGSGQFAEMLEYYLEPELYNFYIVDEFIKALEESGQPTASVHLEFDTGMHRLGFEEKDINQLLTILEKHPEIKIATVFSHLSSADEEQHDDFTRLQISRFETIKNKLKPFLGAETQFHICNSAGITRFPQAHLDMVRLGIGLYGIDVSGEYQDKLQPVFRLKSTISQVREVAGDESVGYSRNGISHTPRKIAVAAIGYADGLRRELSNGNGQLKINGQWAPIVGNVCMDMCMVDVTHIQCHEGDEAILFETNQEIIDFARRLHTIPYEVFTGIGQRVKRVYWQE